MTSLADIGLFFFRFILDIAIFTSSPVIKTKIKNSGVSRENMFGSHDIQFRDFCFVLFVFVFLNCSTNTTPYMARYYSND